MAGAALAARTGAPPPPPLAVTPGSTPWLGALPPLPWHWRRRFLQPGLLLKGVNLLYDDSNIPAGQPRKSWIMRSWQQREAVAEGLAEWQVGGGGGAWVGGRAVQMVAGEEGCAQRDDGRAPCPSSAPLPHTPPHPSPRPYQRRPTPILRRGA